MTLCVCVCVCVLVHVLFCICLCLSRLTVLCCRPISARACLFADLRVTPPSPSRSSPRLSSESAARSYGTRLISSVIKINEVLIAAVMYANDCRTGVEDFLSLLQSEAISGIWCVQEIGPQQHFACSVAVIVCYDAEGSVVGWRGGGV